jgi:ABC-2 type transport system permease protein
VLAVAAVVTLFGSALRADQWLLDVSPFSHIPKLPGHDLTLTPLVWLSAMLLALGAVGLMAFRRRDMLTT